MNASGLRLSVEGVPQGPAPIHWYANSEAIYLFCTDASWASALASLREEIALEASASGLSILVSHQYSTACLQELQYIGHLVRRVRQPLCAINGVLSLIQFESIHSSQTELEELQRAIRGDLDTIRFAFQLKVPVSALVVGLEKERGFRELISRVGRERAMSQRFGRRFDIQAIPARDQMVALATHLCGVFEDWAYTLFREEHALTRPGNTRLYELLSKVRCGWKGRLGEILSGGFGCDTTKREEGSSALFSGCYFAATGDTPDRQAFVKGVIDKMAEEQELIEWTPEAINANKRQKIAANLGAIVVVGLLISLAVMYLFLG